MKTKLFAVILSFFAFSIADAQTNETISELMPLASNIGKFTKKAQKIRYTDYDYDRVKFGAKIEPMNLSDRQKAVAITIKVNYRDLVFEDVGGQLTARIKFYGRITAKDKKIDGFFEETLEKIAAVEELSDLREQKFVTLRKVFELPSGKHQIGIIVRDLMTGTHRVKIIKFQIPSAENTSK